jgi:adenosylcobinamide kinase/adenosylcobinamide-phosphate guanylyltransferase
MVGADSADQLTLVSGPASSGKSRWAEHLAHSSGLAVIYIATGPCLPDDPGWQERLQRHRQRRPLHWQLWEVGGDLAAAIGRLPERHLALVDSLGTWVAAHLDLDGQAWNLLQQELLDTVVHGQVVIVVEECGWGVVPPTAVGGRFRPRHAELQQQLGERAQASWLVVQGRALDLHALASPIPSPPAPA